MKKRVLWLTNVVLPELYGELELPGNMYFGGWLTGLWTRLKQIDDLELAVCCPIINPIYLKDGKYEGYSYFSFLFHNDASKAEETIARFEVILKFYNPDVIQVWGTEYLHSYCMLKACSRMGFENRTVLHIQGIIAEYAKVYLHGLPLSMPDENRGGTTVRSQLEAFMQRGSHETDCMNMAAVVLGRTDWDRRIVQKMAPGARYEFCGEILREQFYGNYLKWSAGECDRHMIFMSQAAYPIKGLHNAVPGLAALKKTYPDIRIVVAGRAPNADKDPYADYLMRLISEYGLEECLDFAGLLSPEEMIGYYQRANVFLCPSNIENSSNSICEAMHVGTPVVATATGGIPSIITDGVSGCLYDLTDSDNKMISSIKRIFDDDSFAEQLSANETGSISKYNDIEAVVTAVKTVYESVW